MSYSIETSMIVRHRMMVQRFHAQRKTTSDSATSTESVLRSRPFAPQSTSLSEPVQQQLELQNQVESTPKLGHSLKNFSLAPHQPSSVVQPKLTIGAPGDKYEQEADRVAQQVVQRLNAPQASQQQAETSVQREAMPEEEEEVQMKPLVQRQATGVTATPELETAIQQSRGGGQPLVEPIRHPLEQAFGNVDFSGVRVHTDAQADQLNRSIQAKAFTTGQDVFFRQGAYQPGSRSGQELLAHELTHVVQQNGSAVQRSLHALESSQSSKIMVSPALSDAKFVQRKVGFEFEADAWNTFVIQRPLTTQEQQIRDTDPNAPNPTATTAGGFTAPPKKGYVIQSVGTGIKPGTGPGFELQADDKDNDHGDLEFVTKPFEENQEGYDSLMSTLGMMRSLMNYIVSLPARGIKKGSYNWPDEHKLSSSVLLALGDRPMQVKPQVTGGIGLDKLASVMENMGVVANESSSEATKRKGGRGKLLSAGGGTMAKILGAAPAMARTAIAHYLPAREMSWQLYKDDFQDTSKLVGLIAMAVAYVKAGVAVSVASYPKTLAPLMSRTKFSALLELLPQEQKDYFKGHVNIFSELVMAAANLKTDFTKQDKIITGDSPLIANFPQAGVGDRIKALTVGRWLTGIPEGKDYLSVGGFQQMLQEDLEGPLTPDGRGPSLTPDDLETSEYLEGFGALGNKTDSGTAIVEFRGIPTMLKHTEIEEFALNFHKYIQNLNSRAAGTTYYGKQT